MTIKQVLEALLIELNKVKAPNLQRTDFIYMFNKGIYQTCNFKYNVYDTTQQLDDDLLPLKVTDYSVSLGLDGRYYSGDLPNDYFHPLNVEVKFSVVTKTGCYAAGDTFIKPATKLTSNASKRVSENYYFKPTYENPYFYLIPNKVQVKYGETSAIVPTLLYMDYLKTPDYVTITQEEIDDVDDTSQVLQFSDYMIYEIINTTVKLILENGGNPRLQTNIPINQTIATPGAAQK